MSGTKVNILSLYNFRVEDLQWLEQSGFTSNEVAKVFQNGTDLVYDSTHKKFKPRLAGAKPLSLAQLVHVANKIRQADTPVKDINGDGKPDVGDGYIDLKEAKKLMLGTLKSHKAKATDPKVFLAYLKHLMTHRYNPIYKNWTNLAGILFHRHLVDTLGIYNDGLLQTDLAHANYLIPGNGLTKTVSNAVLLGPVAVYNIFAKENVPYLMGDAGARAKAILRHSRAKIILSNLKDVFEKGYAKREKWALKGNLLMALKKLSKADAKIIGEQLAGKEIYRIFQIKDDKKRYDALKKFADAERPGAAGFGGGNTSDLSFWNYAGGKNNLYFAASIYNSLYSQAHVAGDPKWSAQFKAEVDQTLKDLKGNGGSFGNALLHWFSLKKVPYRDWSDQNTINAPGRLIFGLSAFAGSWKYGLKLARSIGKIGNYWRLKGFLRGPIKWGLGKIKNIRGKDFNLKASLRKKRNLPTDDMIQAAKDNRKAGKNLAFTERPLHWVNKKLEKITKVPGVKETADTANKVRKSRISNVLVDGFLSFAVANAATNALTKSFKNPFNESLKLQVDPPLRSRAFCNPSIFPKGCPDTPLKGSKAKGSKPKAQKK